MRQIERFAYLMSIDRLWMDHLDAMDDLREGVGLRGYGQRDPLSEYKQEAYGMFERLMVQIDSEVVRRLFRIQVHPPAGPAPERFRAGGPPQVSPQQIETNVDTADMMGLVPPNPMPQQPNAPTPLSVNKLPPSELGGIPQAEKFDSRFARNKTKVGRNDPCWCRSGKKWKKCHYPALG